MTAPDLVVVRSPVAAEPSLFEDPSITREDLALTLQVAHVLLEMLPDYITFPMVASLPNEQLDPCCVLVTKTPHRFSLVVTKELSDAAEVAKGRIEPRELPPSTRALLIDPVDRVPPAIVRELREHALPMAGSDRAPVVRASNDLGPRPTTALDHHILATAAFAAVRLVERHPQIAQPRVQITAALEHVAQVPEVNGAPEVAITTPHPQWTLDVVDGILAHRFRQYARIVANEFAAALTREDWRGDVAMARFVVETLLDFRIEYFDDWAIYSWSSEDVEEFILEYVPYQAWLEPHEVSDAPAILAKFFRWLGEIGRVPAEAAERLSARAERLAKPFAQSFTYADDGFEPTISRNPHRWSPAPNEPHPEPTASCPCGSGRRYKKCCKPR